MFLQMHNRRQFLERSAWGFGSAFVLPTLLQSCMTDHNLPGPDGPIISPPLHDDDIDWNNDAKTIISTLLGLIPDAGGILSGLVNIFWPSGGDVWGQVRAQVEALINQKIDDLVYTQVSATLTGLERVIDKYLDALHPTDENNNPLPPDYETVRDKWNSADDFLSANISQFQLPGYEVLLLPLFAQFANMYLATYRDAVAFGISWGFIAADISNAHKTLVNGIIDFTKYTNDTYNNYLSKLQKVTPNSATNEPFKTANTFTRQMTLWVLNYMDTWPYYDVLKYPNGAKDGNGTAINLFTREIYTDPYGNTYLSRNYIPIVLPSPATQRPTQLSVWGGDRIDAVQLTYPAGGGPGGVTTTPRMGDQNGGTNQPPLGGTFMPSTENPIIQYQVSYSFGYDPNDLQQVVYTMQFKYNDGSTTNEMGKHPGEGKSSGWVGFNYMALSSIYMVYNQENYGGSSQISTCVVFGFLYWNLPSATLRAISRIYITSPRERSVADFAQAFPKLGLSANSISEELKAARKAYWAYIKMRAK